MVRGSIPDIIRNEEGVYEGNLIHYFQILFNHAQNLERPYHNFRHMTHVLWLCHKASQFYMNELTQRQRRNLLIAAIFHDFDHSGMFGNDDLNIERAIRALRKYLDPIDTPHVSHIESLMRGTEYPYAIALENLDLAGKILRDADMGQTLSPAWIQQVVFGLAAEWGKKPIEILRLQEPFLRSMSFHTEWGQKMFPAAAIGQKIEEAQALLALLDTEAPQTA